MNQRYRSTSNGGSKETRGLKPDWPCGPSAVPCSYTSQERVSTDMDADTPIKQLRRNYTHRPMTYDIYGEIAIGINKKTTQQQESHNNSKATLMGLKHQNQNTACQELRKEVQQLRHLLQKQKQKNKQNIDKINELSLQMGKLNGDLRKSIEENKLLRQAANQNKQKQESNILKEDKFRLHSLGRPSKSLDKHPHNPQTHRARCQNSHSVSSHFPKKQIRSVLLQRKNTFMNNSITLGYGRGIPPSFCSLDLNSMGPIQYINMRQPNQMILHR